MAENIFMSQYVEKAKNYKPDVLSFKRGQEHNLKRFKSFR